MLNAGDMPTSEACNSLELRGQHASCGRWIARIRASLPVIRTRRVKRFRITAYLARTQTCSALNVFNCADMTGNRIDPEYMGNACTEGMATRNGLRNCERPSRSPSAAFRGREIAADHEGRTEPSGGANHVDLR